MLDRLLILINAKREELPTAIVAFAYYFLLLFGYYLIRPVRETMGIEAGVKNLHWLFTATFVTMMLIVPLFGYLTSRFTRRHFICISYSLVILSLILFYISLSLSLEKIITARIFYVWVSVFNLFIVSIFWSLMTDLFSTDTSKRLFPFIAAGGTSGAITGPLVTGSIVNTVGIANLLLLSAAAIAIAIACVVWLTRNDGRTTGKNTAMGGNILEAFQLIIRSKYLLGICLLMLLYSTTSTFLYFQQAWIVKTAVITAENKTALFAWMDFSVNLLTLTFQLLITSRLMKHLGLAVTLAIIPLAVTLGFIGLSFAPVLVTIVAFQVIRRAGNYAIMRPAREALYVILSPQEKYKAKNFIDTFVYRTGDVSSAWIYAGFMTLGFSLGAIALIGAAFSLAWLGVAYALGLSYKLKQANEYDN